MQKKIAIFGSVGINRGDDLMNRVLVNFFARQGCMVESASMLPQKMNKIYDTTYFSSRLKNISQWVGAIRRADVVVIGGGTVVQDDFGKTFGGILTYTAVVILVSKLLGKKVHAIGIGFNSIKRPMSKFAINAYRFIDTVCVRDDLSWQLAKKFPWLGHKLSLAADLAFLKNYYTSASLFNPQEKKEKRLLISLVGESHKASAYAVLERAYSIALQNKIPLVGIAMDERKTEEISVFESFKRNFPDFLYIAPATAEDAVHEIGRSCGVISMRLHASIISLVMGRPLVVVSRETKTAWIKEWVPDGMFVSVEECQGPLMHAAIKELIDLRVQTNTSYVEGQIDKNSAMVSKALLGII